jgi:penicillin V acylase-like amidase (Ntn superfamily)
MKRTIHKASLLTAMLLTAIFMAKANACTIVSGIDKNGQVWTANNEDGSPKNINFINVFPKTGDIRYGYFSLTYHSPDEITIQGGMNESGLTFDFNALSTFKVKDRARKQLFPGGDAAILPHILANMDTVEKVVAFFDKYWLSGDSASWQMHVADRHGHFAIIGPSGSIIFTDAPYLVSTNFNIVGKELHFLKKPEPSR